MDHSLLNASGYERLLTAGFRRSGNDIYRPHCPACNACQSLRIHSERFVPSRSQKRIRQLNQDIELVLSYDDKPEYYQLYERYIRERHHDGSMYPPAVPSTRASCTATGCRPSIWKCARITG